MNAREPDMTLQAHTEGFVHSGLTASVPPSVSELTVSDWHDISVEREAILDATADLFEEIAAFMANMVPRTFADMEGAADPVSRLAMRRRHLEVLRIRDEYRGASKENRRDVELLVALREASRLSAPPSPEQVGGGDA